jgi:glycosyltransferase involved in cell wall biosynthesis
MHIVTASPEFQNTAERNRLKELEKRRGATLITRRQIPVSKNLIYADFLEGFGNKTIRATYANAGKSIFPIPISAVKLFDFPEDKDFDTARTHFLWFGGGGAVLKGLDLVLEAFVKNPSLYLHICGPVAAEKDFVETYKKELYETPNIHLYGRIDATTDLFKKIIDTCGALIYPAFSEGTSGAVVQTMHAGIVPIITPETGIDEETGGMIIIKNPTVDSVSEAINVFSTIQPKKIKDMAHEVWSYARAHYTRESFSTAYTHFINDILHL